MGSIQLTAGEYEVTVHLITWENEPGAKDAQGQPTAEALPDFVVLVNEADGAEQSYRKETNTFDQY